jgi:hypothetical protein
MGNKSNLNFFSRKVGYYWGLCIWVMTSLKEGICLENVASSILYNHFIRSKARKPSKDIYVVLNNGKLLVGIVVLPSYLIISN